MRLNSWLTELFRYFSAPGFAATAHRTTNRSTSSRRSIEQLESRQLLSAAVLAGTQSIPTISPQPLPNGPMTRVNTTTTGDQTSPEVATDAAGDYVVVWLSGDIHGQRYSRNGKPAGSEFEVVASTGIVTAVSVAMDATGDFVVSWSLSVSHGPISGDPNPQSQAISILPDGVYAQRFNAAGVAQGNTLQIGSQSAYGPSVAMDAAGDFVVAEIDNNQTQIQRFNASGIAQGAEFQVNTNTSYVVVEPPSVAMDKAGDFVVTWTSTPASLLNKGTEPTDVFARRFNSAGITIGSEFNVSNGQFFSSQDAKVAMDATGDFMITWFGNTVSAPSLIGNTQIVAQIYNFNLTVSTNEIHVTTGDAQTGVYRSTPSIDADAAGNFVITWSRQVIGTISTQDVLAQVYYSNGSKDGNQFVVTAGTYWYDDELPVVAMDSEGDFVIAWQGQLPSGNGFDIYAQQYTVGPTINSVQVNSGPQPIRTGDTLISPISQLTVDFSSNLNTVAGGINSVTNTGNWKLFRYGVDFSSLITNVSFHWNAATQQYMAVVTFSRPLLDGGYQLVVLARIQDLTGRPLDGAGNGIQGSDYTLNFFVEQTLAVGSETRVNTYTTSQQTAPAIATDAKGDYIIVWTSVGDGSSTGIYGQRYNAAGVAQGTQFLVNTYTTGTENQPSVAIDATGDFVVTWTQYNNFATAKNFATIQAQRYNANGVAVGHEFTVDTYTTNVSDQNSSVAMDASGAFVVSWTREHQLGAPVNIFAQRFNSAGVALGPEFQVSKESGQQGSSSVAIDAAGDFVVAWVDTGAPFPAIHAQRFSAAGAALGTMLTVGTNDAGLPRVAMDAAGDFVVTWMGYQNPSSGFDVFAKRYNAQGIAAGAAVVVNSFTSRYQENPSIAMDAAGDYVISWQSYAQDGSNWGVYAQRYSPAGFAEGLEFRVNTDTRNVQADPAVGIDSKGDFVIAWQSYSQDGNGYGIYAQRYTTEIAPLLSQPPSTIRIVNPFQPSYVDPSLMIFDHNDTQLVSAAIQITGNYLPGQDKLIFTNTPTITGSWNPTTGTLKLTGIDSVANYRAALQSVQFETSSTSNSVRTFSFVVADGILTSNTIDQSLEVVSVQEF